MTGQRLHSPLVIVMLVDTDKRAAKRRTPLYLFTLLFIIYSRELDNNEQLFHTILSLGIRLLRCNLQTNGQSLRNRFH